MMITSHRNKSTEGFCNYSGSLVSDNKNKKVIIVKKYIRASAIFGMSVEKAKLMKRMDAWSDHIASHLSKCAMYCDTLPGEKYDHWIEELSVWLFSANDMTCKPNNKKLKPAQYESLLFGWLSDETAEARSNLHDLQMHNSKYNENSYPYIKVDNAMIERMRKISADVLKVFVSILASKNNLTLEDTRNKLHAIIDPVCKNI